MNIIQLHERVRFWIDVVGSTRFESEDIDNALNATIDQKVRESYDQNRPMNRSDAFQRVQRIRDELGPLVKKAINASGISVSGHEITITAEDYGWLLSLKVKAESDSVWYPAYPITYDRKNVVEKNPFRRVRNTPSSKIYYNEYDGKIEISMLNDADINDAELYYLAVPAIVNYGIEKDNGDTLSNGDVVYAVEETVYGGNTYTIGQKITINTGDGYVVDGKVVTQWTDCDIRQTAHEEIARRAAINCLLTANQYDKAKALRDEIMAS